MMPPMMAPTPWADATMPAIPVPPPYSDRGVDGDETDERNDRQVEQHQEGDAMEAARREAQRCATRRPTGRGSCRRFGPAGNARRTNVTATASTTNEAALKPIVHAGPTVNTSAVPSSGPMMRPLFHE